MQVQMAYEWLGCEIVVHVGSLKSSTIARNRGRHVGGCCG